MTGLNDGAYYSDASELAFEKISREAEIELFRRFHDDNDLAARDTIIKNHLLLVAKIARRAGRGRLPGDDAVSVGNEMLLKLLERRQFRPSMKVRFSSYLRKFIWGAVKDACGDQSIVRAPLSRCISTVPLDAEIEDEVEDETEAPENSDDREFMLKKLRLALDRKWLTNIEKHVVTRNMFHGERYGQIGAELPKYLDRPAVCRQRIQQIHRAALAKLKTLLRQYGVDR